MRAKITNKAEEKLIEDLFEPFKNFFFLLQAVTVSTQDFPNPSVHPSQLMGNLFKSGVFDFHKIIDSLLHDDTPDLIKNLINETTSKLGVIENMTLSMVLLIITGNIMVQVLESADEYLLFSGKSSDKLNELKEKLSFFKNMNKILNSKQVNDETILKKYTILFKEFSRRPTDAELATPTEKNSTLNEKQKEKLINKIGRIRRNPEFIIRQINWLKDIVDDKRIKDYDLKKSASDEMSRLAISLDKQTRKQQKYQRRKELPLDEDSYISEND